MFHHNVKQCYPFFKGPCWGIVIIFQEAISQLHGFDPFGFCQEDISLIKKLNELNHFFYWMQQCCLMLFFKSHQSPVLLELVQKPSGTIWFLMLWDPNWPRSCGALLDLWSLSFSGLWFWLEWPGSHIPAVQLERLCPAYPLGWDCLGHPYPFKPQKVMEDAS